jgi:heme/copper-type cytochrome/quinol oxidase subunit 3
MVRAAVTWATIVLLIAVVLAFAVLRVAEDAPFLVSGTLPEAGSFEARYVGHPWLAYLHIAPGVLYLLGAPMQLSRRFRERHLGVHRRLGRVVLMLGLTSGVFALAFGVPFSYGGAWQSLGAAVFGSWFLVALLLAYRAIRARRVRDHRRWMIRAFATGLGVGTIRIWIGLFTAVGVEPLQSVFASAFWLGLSMHVIAAEVYLRWRPDARGRPRVAPAP